LLTRIIAARRKHAQAPYGGIITNDFRQDVGTEE
jgi:hypothetical protein